MTESKQTVRQRQGAAGEDAALIYLQRAGLKLIARNVRYPVGEIDLIMCAGNALVFVEVRLRSSSAFGGALASVTASKQARIRKAAQRFLQTHAQWHDTPCRFDVIGIQNGEFEWLAGAF